MATVKEIPAVCGVIALKTKWSNGPGVIVTTVVAETLLTLLAAVTMAV